MLFKFSSVCTFLSTTVQDDCKRRTLFRVFRGHVVFEGIYFFFCICDNRPWHFLRCRFSVFFLAELCLAIFWAVFTGFLVFLLSRAKEVFYSSPRICSSVQNKEEPPGHFKKTLLFVFNSSKGDNGFENIVK